MKYSDQYLTLKGEGFNSKVIGSEVIPCEVMRKQPSFSKRNSKDPKILKA